MCVSAYKLDRWNYFCETSDVRDKLITIALADTFGEKKAAAGLLGISVETLLRRVKERIKRNE